jgi:pyruvate/2-oxoglutarate dehydrogenase complex dihydrolipoamide acyltransferase (E2) component
MPSRRAPAKPALAGAYAMIAEANIEVIWAFVIIASIVGQLIKAAKRGTGGSAPGTAPGGAPGPSRQTHDELREFLESIGQRATPPPPPPPPQPAGAVRPATPTQAAQRMASTKVRPVAPRRAKPAATQRHIAPSQMRQTPGPLNNRSARTVAPPVAAAPAHVKRSPTVAMRVAPATARAYRHGKDESRMAKRHGADGLRRALRNDLHGTEAIQRAVLLREILGPPPGLGPLRG